MSKPRKRHNISDACAACRRSKVKCDELKPCRRCLRDGRRIACVSWRDGKPQTSVDLHAETLAGVSDVAAVGEGAPEEPEEKVVKKRRRSKSEGCALTSLVLPSLCWIKPEEPSRAPSVQEEGPEQQEQMKEASDLLLSFARECRKVAAD